MAPRDPVAVSLDALSRKVEALSVQVAGQEKRLHMVYTVVVLVVGAIGGPNAVQALTGQ